MLLGLIKVRLLPLFTVTFFFFFFRFSSLHFLLWSFHSFSIFVFNTPLLSPWLLRVRTRWSLCSWFPATSTPWSTSFNRTTSPKRTWLCWRPSCPGKDVTEWANQQAACRYKIPWLPSHLQEWSTYMNVFALGARRNSGGHILVFAHFWNGLIHFFCVIFFCHCQQIPHKDLNQQCVSPSLNTFTNLSVALSAPPLCSHWAGNCLKTGHKYIV